MRHKLLITYLGAGLLMSACSSSNLGQPPHPTTANPAFISDYSLLKPVESAGSGMKIYRYVNPEFSPADYHAVIIDPVVINQNSSESTITPEVLAKAKQTLDDYLRETVSKKFKLASKPGPGIARLKVIITGAELEGDGFKPRNILPISAAIRLATKAAGYDNKKAALEVASKITDSQSGKLLGASVGTITGEKFRNSDKSTEEFVTLAKSWVVEISKNAAGLAGK